MCAPGTQTVAPIQRPGSTSPGFWLLRERKHQVHLSAQRIGAHVICRARVQGCAGSERSLCLRYPRSGAWVSSFQRNWRGVDGATRLPRREQLLGKPRLAEERIVAGFSIRNGLFATVVVLALAGVVPASAAESRSSLYVSLDTGANFAAGLEFHGGDNDRASICDEYINPQYASIAGCTGPRPGDSWQGSFGSASGVLAGTTLGYRFNDRFRVEANYVFRGSEYDETAPLQSASGETFAKVSGEIRA